MPHVEHESCRKRLDELEDTVRRLKLELADIQLEVLDKAEQVAARLKDRERKREDRAAPPAPVRRPRPWELAKRGQGGNDGV